MIQSHQNWNGYTVGVGASMCNVTLILPTILKGHTSENYHYDMPFATELTLGGHGHSDTVHSEYMIHKPLIENTGGYHQSYYLDAALFAQEHHREKIMKLFSEEVPMESYPAPHPTVGT